MPKKEIPFFQIVPDDYVDIHSHLIPGIDDGVKTIYQSTYIIERFKELGFKKIITTPHVMQEVWPNSSEIIRKKHLEMQSVLKTLNVTDIDFSVSAEYMMDDLFYTLLKNKDIIPLYDNYILVEMSTFNPPINLKEILFEIKLTGYTPILAHPERYSFYHNDLKKYEELKEAGILFQLNLLSLSGFYGEKVQDISMYLLSKGAIDFCGTDVHNYSQLELLEKGFFPKYAKKIIPIMERNSKFL
ncbi:tyrosine-protein phosphatase [Aquimarina sp. 2201CG5-10]|uniref:tyrosine-protein phosphatase n=1 Tax=Aquimarina callyspongiae TaxID=3098150 RepID=UPI002AB483E4|nr:CpsB/CapC family capsule biosynthesis tyrosine phosphatase [Aquimarina sp. 2201CG5-10]MDY8136270.1 CpsB/CapC family capsule biosynthesis tyrosine phosphatase [Aquimarina sp. 2201CG5-10]